MNIYSKLRAIASGNIPGFIKIMGLWSLLSTRRRMIGIFMDPVNGYNLRCRMCYMSDEDKRHSLTGRMTDSDLALVKEKLYPVALKLQIGCGSEPTLDFSRLEEIVKDGREAGVPYISLTTNGQLIASGKVDLIKLYEVGLNELTLSLHGTNAETYEYLMPGGSFEMFKRMTTIIGEVKKKYPYFKLRINFTVNSMNVENLADDSFWQLWQGYTPDIVQLRPVQDLGVSQWRDFSTDRIKELYLVTIGKIISECKERGITVIAPTLEQIDDVITAQDSTSALIEDITYCYVSPDSCYKPDFNLREDTFASYHHRKGTRSRLLKAIFRNHSRDKNQTKKLNYNIK